MPLQLVSTPWSPCATARNLRGTSTYSINLRGLKPVIMCIETWIRKINGRSSQLRRPPTPSQCWRTWKNPMLGLSRIWDDLSQRTTKGRGLVEPIFEDQVLRFQDTPTVGSMLSMAILPCSSFVPFKFKDISEAIGFASQDPAPHPHHPHHPVTRLF